MGWRLRAGGSALGGGVWGLGVLGIRDVECGRE